MYLHLRGVVLLLGELGGHGDSVAVGVDANGLVVDVTLVLAAVLIDEVQRVARELDATGLLALAEEGILLACNSSYRTYLLVLDALQWGLCFFSAGRWWIERTGDLPDEVGGDVLVGEGHFGGVVEEYAGRVCRWGFVTGARREDL